MKKLVLALALSSINPVCAAEFLVQQPGDSVPTMIVQKNGIPTPGLDIPVGSKVGQFISINGDSYPGNYRISTDGSVSYEPPAPPAPQVLDPNRPRLPEFETAIFEDGTIPLEARMALADKFPLLDKYIALNPQALSLYWGGLKMGAGSAYSWLTSDVILKVEAHATAFHIPLVPTP